MSVSIATQEAVNSVTVEDAKARLDDLVARVLRGEEWVITNPGGQIVALLVPAKQMPAPAPERWKAFGMMKGQIKIAADFDEPLEDFKPYME